jgi:hypothetical protein
MLQGAWLAMEAQQVIALRLMKLAMGGPAAKQEAHRMMAEKLDAATEAAGIMAAAAMRGAQDGGTNAVVQMLRRRVRANRKRLGSS